MDVREPRCAVNVLLDVEPLYSPLTGIGQYTKNLAEGLARHPDVTKLDFTAHGRRLAKSPLGGTGAPSPAIPPDGRSRVVRAIGSLRSTLSRSGWAVRTYEALLPVLSRRALRRFERSHVLHSPNFVLPDFGGRKVVTFHDLSTILYSRYHPPVRVAFINRAMERAANSADHVITDSEFVRRQVIDHFSIAPDRCTAIPLGADATFRPRGEQACAGVLQTYGLRYKQYCMFASTIEPRKNLMRVLRAYQVCQRRGEARFPLLVVGHPGWHSEREHALLRTMQHAGVVKYLGYVPASDLPTLFSAARCLLFPSLYEGFGLPVLEAMQSGTAVLTSQNSSMHEICGDAGVIVDPRNTRQIVDRWSALMNDDRLSERHAAAGLAAATAFSWESCVASTVKVYHATRS